METKAVPRYPRGVVSVLALPWPVIAGLTVLAAVAGWFVGRAAGDAVRRLTGDDDPRRSVGRAVRRRLLARLFRRDER
ncbi:MAG: hypothetical protein D6705_10965 [Deltaproteobacteria bacterium]|nr:MAG: hypothetical protein D6705_10965 [Deltaproteobacteria bacterium]